MIYKVSINHIYHEIYIKIIKFQSDLGSKFNYFLFEKNN